MNSLQWRSIKSLALEQNVPVEKILEMASSGEQILSLWFDGDLVPFLDGDERLERLQLERKEIEAKQAKLSPLEYLKSISQCEGIEDRGLEVKILVERHLQRERGRKSIHGLIDILPEDVIRFVGGVSTELFRCCIREKDGSSHVFSITDKNGKRPKFSIHDIVVRVHAGSDQPFDRMTKILSSRADHESFFKPACWNTIKKWLLAAGCPKGDWRIKEDRAKTIREDHKQYFETPRASQEKQRK